MSNLDKCNAMLSEDAAYMSFRGYPEVDVDRARTRAGYGVGSYLPDPEPEDYDGA